MHIKNTVSTDMLHLELKQLGADKIVRFPTKVVVVRFELMEDVYCSYFCHVRAEDKVYLQRIDPYPIRNHRFQNIDEIIKFIKKDLAKFQNAAKSHNFKKYLEIIDKNYQVRSDMEDLFLENNVPEEVLDKLNELESQMLKNIEEIERITL
ncbi:MAG: hypothetical protein U0K95_03055 [Eubacterium sp.]|jgi:hypothetical protein|nr:hypothetical protein [Eubacterium sp.]